MKPLILALDQGTTSSRAIVFDAQSRVLAVAQYEFPQHYPQNAWVEHEPEDIWQTSLQAAQDVFTKVEREGLGKVVAIGITNQRETTFLWDKSTGEPLHRAIVWQDRRTSRYCEHLKAQGLERDIQYKTGLLLDPYFSASKLNWLLQHLDVKNTAEKGKLAFGTVDSFLIYKLTGGKQHLTDATNASRTSLFNIRKQEWDDDLLKIFDIPATLLPEVKDCADDYGFTDKALFGREIPILGVAGDQHAATIGQACFNRGDIKSTYGTGCFVMVNTGHDLLESRNRLLGTIAYRLKGECCYALEGSIFIAGAAMQWLRDGLKIIESAAESAELAASLESNEGVFMVPAFTGLGAPWWDPNVRGSILGLTRASRPAHIVRAALESVCYQTRDLIDAVRADGCEVQRVRVDGGMVANNWFAGFLADILGSPIDKPQILETTALGAAYLAALQYGLYQGLDDIQEQWRLQESFDAKMPQQTRLKLLEQWHSAVNATRGYKHRT